MRALCAIEIKGFSARHCPTMKIAHQCCGHTQAHNAALGNGVPSLATMKASLDARRPQGCPAGAAAAPARAARRRIPSAWLRPAARAQQGEGLHSAAVGRVRRRLVLQAPVPRGRRLRGTRTLRLRHGARVSTHGTCTSTARWSKFH